MKLYKRITTSFFAALIVLIAVLSIYPLQAEAITERATEQVSFGGTSNAASQCAYRYYNFPIHLVKNYTPQTAKAAVYNKSSKGQTLYLLVFRFKANKKAHVKISYSKKGKTYKNDVYITPEKYTSPAKSVKIGKQLYFTGNTWAITYNRTLNGKISVTPKKGWKVAIIYKYNINKFYNPKLTTYKNNSKINVKKNERLMIIFQNKKTGKVVYMMHDCYFNHSYSG